MMGRQSGGQERLCVEQAAEKKQEKQQGQEPGSRLRPSEQDEGGQSREQSGSQPEGGGGGQPVGLCRYCAGSKGEERRQKGVAVCLGQWHLFCLRN